MLENLVRMQHGPILETLGLLLLTWVFAVAIRKLPVFGRKTRLLAYRGALVLSAFIIAFFFWTLANHASVNMTPRSVIDRSHVNESAENFDKKNREQALPNTGVDTTRATNNE